MVVGLPGTGIGGLFYILLALMMPAREAFALLTGKGRSAGRWGNVALQTVNAGGIVAGLWGLGWLLGVAVQWARVLMDERLAAGSSRLMLAAHQASNLVSAASAYLALVTLTVVILAVEILSLVTKTREAPAWRVRPNAPSAD